MRTARSIFPAVEGVGDESSADLLIQRMPITRGCCVACLNASDESGPNANACEGRVRVRDADGAPQSLNGGAVSIGITKIFDRRLKLEFYGSRITSDAGLLAYRELDDALGLTGMISDKLVDVRTGKNSEHAMTRLFRQSVFGRLGGYEDVNDADRLGRDPAMRWIVGGRPVAKAAASTSQMGRFETGFLATDESLAALADLSGRWIERGHERHPSKTIVLDIDSSVSPTHGD